MFAKTQALLIALAVGMAFGPGGPAIAATAGGAAHDSHAEPSGHAGHAGTGAALQLQLDHGKKWQTDAPLRQGMSEIRAAMAGAQAAIHESSLTPEGYGALASRVEREVETMIRECKLPEEADAWLHEILGQILDGADAMKNGPARQDGAAKIVEAVNVYGASFDHPLWQPLTE